MFAVIHEFYFASTLQKTSNDRFGLPIQMTIHTASNRLYDYMTGIGMITEKRPLIDLAIIRKAFKVREIADIIWVPLMKTLPTQRRSDVPFQL